ncbi:hypothetical protein GQ53DRAFT_852380 [Thozetella sp. PMI_491]|nr:hypothetical protein GQ53DRAFT_852380 [Thozetella sp. PMI_491]
MDNILRASSSPEDDVWSAESTQIWIQASELRTGLRSWKIELEKMLSHANELEKTHFTKADTDSEGLQAMKHQVCLAGIMIKEKLEELIGEYREKIDECGTILDGMTLATHLEWNKIARKDAITNIHIAQTSCETAEATMKDGKQMKTVALVTMLFLPTTFTAGIFSTSFFDWQAVNANTVVSPYFGLFVGASIFLTAITLYFWYCCTYGTVFKLCWMRVTRIKSGSLFDRTVNKELISV